MKRVNVVFAGECGVGKTSLVRKLLGGEFESEYYPSIDLERDLFTLKLGEEREVAVEFVEIPGDPTVHVDTYNECYLSTDVIYILYNRNDMSSFKAVAKRMERILRLTKEKLLVIVANMSDEQAGNVDMDDKPLGDDAEAGTVPVSAGLELAKEYGARFFQISVLNDQGIMNMLVSTVSAVLDGIPLNMKVLSMKEKISVLSDAVKASNLVHVEALADYIDFHTLEDDPLLIVAARYNQPRMVKYFLDFGMPLSVKTKDGATALHFASWIGNLELVQLLISAGADINAERNDGWTPLHFASKGGHSEVVELLLKSNCNSNPRSRVGSTPLLIAVSAGDMEIVRILLRYGVDVNHKGDRSQTCIFFAVRGCNLELVKLLLESGARVDVSDVFGLNPMHIVVEIPHGDDIARLLLENGGDILGEDTYGRNALMHAVSKDNIEIYDIYMSKLDNITDELKSRLLLEAAYAGSMRMLSKVYGLLGPATIAEFGEDWEGKGYRETSNPNMSLLKAVEAGNCAAVKSLLSKGVDVTYADGDGNTALHVAAKCKDFQCMEQLLDGAVVDGSAMESTAIDANAKNALGETALHVFVLKHTDATFLGLLLSSGADPNERDLDGNTAVLAAAAKRNESTTLRMLLEAEGDANLEGYGGLTPLFIAMLMLNHKNVSLLIEFGASEVKLVNVNGMFVSPLSYAITTSNIPCISTLIEGGVDLSARLDNGALPVQMAVDPEVSKLLIANGAEPDASVFDDDDSGDDSLFFSDLDSIGFPNEEGRGSLSGSDVDSSYGADTGNSSSPYSSSPRGEKSTFGHGTGTHFESYLKLSIGNPLLSPDGEATFYPIRVLDLRNSKEHTVKRRFREFRKLYLTISPLASKPLPRHPPKRFFGRFKDNRVVQRKEAFSAILSAITTDPNLVQCQAVREFLSI